MILQDDGMAAPPHPLLEHPLASQLIECVAAWIGQESIGEPATEELERLRDVASEMILGL